MVSRFEIDDHPTRVPCRVLIVEDHPLVRDGLCELIRGEPDLVVCGTAGSRAETFEAVEHLSPDLVVLDLSLPDCDGTRLIHELARRQPELRILVFSAHEEAVFGERCLRAGARGFVNKRAAGPDVRRAIRVVALGGEFLGEGARMRRTPVPKRGPARDAHGEPEGPDALSDRELDVFRLLGRGKGPSEIARTLGLSVKTVEGYEERIKLKLGLANASELYETATSWYHVARR